jgi:hypothetical protein
MWGGRAGGELRKLRACPYNKVGHASSVASDLIWIMYFQDFALSLRRMWKSLPGS